MFTLIRGNKLDDVSEISKNLASESKKYKWGAKQLSFMVMLLIIVLFVYSFIKTDTCFSF